MQSKPAESTAERPRHLYEYAVVQFTPSVERGEQLNVGLVMMCKRRRWVKARIALDPQLIALFAPGWDVDTLQRQLESFGQVAAGTGDSPIAALDAHERFRWLTAVRSACITTSRPHPGHTTDLEATFDQLFATLVAR